MQGSEAWKQWRRNKIGSSDAAILMGVGFITPYQLWTEKTYGIEREVNHAMQRGTLLEPIAREWFIKETGIVVEPDVIIHPQYDFIIASLDGINREKKVLVEIKCPGEKVYKMAIDGKIPDYYFPQIQHQLAVTGYESALYVCFSGESGVIIEVKRDDDYIVKLLDIEKKFYKCLVDFEEPPLTEKDFVDMSENQSWAKMAAQWREINAQMKDMKDKEEKIRKELIEMANKQPAKGAGIKINSYLRKGAIDYSRLCSEFGINAEKYRGHAIECWKIQQVNSKEQG